MKYRWVILSLLCLVPLYVFGLWSFTDTDLTESALENRKLEPKPSFTAQNLWNGDWARQWETYYADTFPLRDTFMRLNRAAGVFYTFSLPGAGPVLLMERAAADQHEEGGVSLLDTDALPSPIPTPVAVSAPVLASAPEPEPAPEPTPEPTPEPPALHRPDENEVEKAGDILIIGTRALEIPYAVPEVITRYAQVISRAAEVMPAARVFSLITPNGAEFYAPESMRGGLRSQKDMIQSMYDQLSPRVTPVDAYSALRMHTDEELFFRTDHHWTQRAAYYAYTAFCEEAAWEAPPLSDFDSGMYDFFVGSMYTFTANYPQSKLLMDNPDTLTYYLPLFDCQEWVYENAAMENGMPVPVIATQIKPTYRDKYICYIGGDNPLSLIEADNGSDRSIMVVKESYGNAFVPFLTTHYGRVYVVDPRKWNGKKQPGFSLPAFMDEHEIDDLLFINYPFNINNPSFCTRLENLLA